MRLRVGTVVHLPVSICIGNDNNNDIGFLLYSFARAMSMNTLVLTSIKVLS